MYFNFRQISIKENIRYINFPHFIQQNANNNKKNNLFKVSIVSNQ